MGLQQNMIIDLVGKALLVSPDQLAGATKLLDVEIAERLKRVRERLELGEELTYSAQGLNPVLLHELAIFSFSRLGLGMAKTNKDGHTTGFYSVIQLSNQRVLLGANGVHTLPPEGESVQYFDWEDDDQAEELTNLPNVLDLLDEMRAGMDAAGIPANTDTVNAYGEYAESMIADRLLAGIVLR
jgi:hypothetical protein